MWPYYGSKSKIIRYYDPPRYGKIIECFAGSARYALEYFDREVLLVDKYPVIVETWRYLQQASEAEILSLPDVEDGESIEGIDLPLGAKYLIGFCINGGSAQPKLKATKKNRYRDGNRIRDLNFNSWHRDKKRIAKSVYKIRHWKIELGSYEDIPNEAATWFIDPPYQKGGEYYRVNNKTIDYPRLASWARSREGQVIVCENTSADWMEFEPLVSLSGSIHKTMESIWTNYPRYKQQSLF